MPTFIDESGDTGYDPQSSPHFRLVAVWVPTYDVAEAFRNDVRGLRRQFALPSAYEFKFAKTGAHSERRERFLQLAMKHRFHFAAVSIDKRHPEWQSASGQKIHWACAVSLAAALRLTYLKEERDAAPAEGRGRALSDPVIVDNNDDASFLTIIQQKFRELKSECKPGASLVGKVRFHNSRSEEMLQLADMVCGAVGRYLDGEATWYKMICGNDLGITTIP